MGIRFSRRLGLYKKVTNIFEENSGEIYYVELEADYDVRFARNRTENRLFHKPTKRNIEHSEKMFKLIEEKYRLNSLPNEITFPNYLKINNTNLDSQDVAKTIKEYFNL